MSSRAWPPCRPATCAQYCSTSSRGGQPRCARPTFCGDTRPKRRFWPSAIDPAAYRRFETWALSVLPDEFVELVLAPHAPLGTSSVLGTFSQDRVMTTTADSEVVSDSTNVLALECARRRRAPASRRGPAPTRLAASHRMLRPRDGAHFGLLALCTAGRDRRPLRDATGRPARARRLARASDRRACGAPVRAGARDGPVRRSPASSARCGAAATDATSVADGRVVFRSGPSGRPQLLRRGLLRHPRRTAGGSCWNLSDGGFTTGPPSCSPTARSFC